MAEKIGVVKQKIKALSTAGVKKLAVDIVKLCYKDIDEIDHGEVSDASYAQYTDRLLRKLKAEYKKQLDVEVIISRQRDLEELINALKTGTEPIWDKK
jgi:hypothetical protein